ncbi:hypothetical protein GF402_05465 [Candidatus Fermentibacteria bacterium]|nr:hypothetical protein [Candidatus Fermentibacteria bacterium]
MSRTRKVMAACAILAVALAGGCWNPFNPDQGEPDEFQYHSFCDSGYKVLENLEYAYRSRDIDRYLDCFRDDFEFKLLEVDWADYNGDGTIDKSWGLDLEEKFNRAMFEGAQSIELTLEGPNVGEPYGNEELFRMNFDLKVYTEASQGYRASGQAYFYCAQDSTDEWYIHIWEDLSDY